MVRYALAEGRQRKKKRKYCVTKDSKAAGAKMIISPELER
jgi:hypothetical protein